MKDNNKKNSRRRIAYRNSLNYWIYGTNKSILDYWTEEDNGSTVVREAK